MVDPRQMIPEDKGHAGLQRVVSQIGRMAELLEMPQPMESSIWINPVWFGRWASGFAQWKYAAGENVGGGKCRF